MSDILSAIVPVFLVAGAAYALRRRHLLDTKTLSLLNIYLLIPCLVFASLSKSNVHWDLFARYGAGVLALQAAMTVILRGVGRHRGLEGPALSAFMMTMFMNLGNFGLPVCKFAFGEPGLVFAVIAMVCGSFLQNSLGIYFAQRAQAGAGQAVVRTLQFPMMYAFALALLCQQTGWWPPVAVFRAIEITGDAAIPIQLLILGIQLAEARLETGANIFLAAGIRLVGGPILALLIGKALGLEGLAAQVFIVQMSGPVAVSMAAYGVQFDVAPRFLASIVAWTFLLSLASISVVLFLVQRLAL